MMMHSKSFDRYFFYHFLLISYYFNIENAYNAVQDILSVYGLAMSTSDIMDAFNKKNDATTAVSIRDLANSCKYFIMYIYYIHRVHLGNSRCAFVFPF